MKSQGAAHFKTRRSPHLTRSSRKTMYDYKISLIKAFKAAAIVLLASLGTALISPEFAKPFQEVAGHIPFVGGTVAAFIVAGLAAAATALDNWRKHFLS